MKGINNPYACWLDESVPIINKTQKELQEKYKNYTYLDLGREHHDKSKLFYHDMDNHFQGIQHRRNNFLKEVDQAIKDYFMFKYNVDLDEMGRVKNSVNNFKLHSRFQKIVSLSTGQENYYDGEFLFLTVVDHPLKENLIIRHGWSEEEK